MSSFRLLIKLAFINTIYLRGLQPYSLKKNYLQNKTHTLLPFSYFKLQFPLSAIKLKPSSDIRKGLEEFKAFYNRLKHKATIITNI